MAKEKAELTTGDRLDCALQSMRDVEANLFALHVEAMRSGDQSRAALLGKAHHAASMLLTKHGKMLSSLLMEELSAS